MSRFPLSWLGNKRLEAARILPHIPAWADVLCEPFAGSAAISMEVFYRDPSRKIAFYLNDTDPWLIEFYTRVRAEGLDGLIEWTKARLNAEDWFAISRAGDVSLEAWFYNRKVKPGRFDPKKEAPRKWPLLATSERNRQGIDFIRRAGLTLFNGDWLAAAARVERDPRAVIYLDPPYFSSYNQEYYGMKRETDDNGQSRDGTAVFVQILRLMNRAAATVILSTNGVAILQELYSSYIIDVYSHTYAYSIKRKNGEYSGTKMTHLLAVKRAEEPRPPLSDDDISDIIEKL